MGLNTLFGNKVDIAIELLRAMQPPDEPYWLAFSGGKDSITIHQLCVEGGINFVAHFNRAMEPPEIIKFIRDEYPNVIIHHPDPTMWQLIEKNRFPPTQNMKYCCGALKEKHGEGLVITGIRAEESSKRKGRKQIEVCRNKIGKRFIHPILNWTEEEVWEFIKMRGLPYPSLYDEGRKRIGCVICPMGNSRQMEADVKRWPKLAKAFLRTFDKVIEKRKLDGLPCDWTTGEEMMDWWIYRRKDKENENQERFFFE
jgi:phosphoadenosine phosphosulfate reductase